MHFLNEAAERVERHTPVSSAMNSRNAAIYQLINGPCYCLELCLAANVQDKEATLHLCTLDVFVADLPEKSRARWPMSIKAPTQSRDWLA